jgi:hypothetical protein
MPKAGLFAGEVTQSAPANLAVTSKPKGFTWMEWGNFIADFQQASEFSPTEGYVMTQDGFLGGTSFANPWTDIDTPTWTMMAVCRPEGATALLGGQSQHIIDLGITPSDSPSFNLSKRPISDQIYFYTSLANALTNQTIFFDTVELTVNHPTWLLTDWYCIAVSYDQANPSKARFMAVNLTQAEETVVTPFISNTINVATPASPTTGSNKSIVGYGVRAQTSAPDSPWRGQIGQVFVHDKALDLTQVSDRRKLSGIDGIIDLGDLGQNVFGEQPLYYTPDGLPTGNVGSIYVGVETDYWANGTFVPATNLPPLAS